MRLHGYFGPVYLLQVSKNYDEERSLKSNLALFQIYCLKALKPQISGALLFFKSWGPPVAPNVQTRPAAYGVPKYYFAM